MSTCVKKSGGGGGNEAVDWNKNFLKYITIEQEKIRIKEYSIHIVKNMQKSKSLVISHSFYIGQLIKIQIFAFWISMVQCIT